MLHAFLSKSVRDFAFRKGFIDELPEVFLDQLCERLGGRIILHHGESAFADAILQRLEFHFFRRPFAQVGAAFFL